MMCGLAAIGEMLRRSLSSTAEHSPVQREVAGSAPAETAISRYTDPLEFDCRCGQRIVATFDRLDRDPYIRCARCGATFAPTDDYSAVQVLQW